MSKSNLPYRTHRTWLTDDQLILLDRLFDLNMGFCSLRRDRFEERWNVPHSHAMPDDELLDCLHELFLRGVVGTWADGEHPAIYYLSPAGGELWSRERCPVWDRYCTETYKITSKDRRLMRVTAVSPQVRDHFLRLFPRYHWGRPAGPARVLTVTGHEPLAWHPFGRLHVGLVTFDERLPSDPAAASEVLNQWHGNHRRLDRERTWWRDVYELQKFVGPETERI